MRRRPVPRRRNEEYGGAIGNRPARPGHLASPPQEEGLKHVPGSHTEAGWGSISADLGIPQANLGAIKSVLKRAENRKGIFAVFDQSSTRARFRYPESVTPPTIRPHGRFSLEQREDDLWIFIGPRRRWGTIIFMAIWLCGWALGESVALLIVLRKLLGLGWETNPPMYFLAVWLSIWTFGGFFALYTLLTEAWRWEEIYCSREVLFRRIRLGLWTRDLLIPLAEVHEIRLTTPRHSRDDWRKAGATSGGGEQRGIAVDYGAGKTFLLVREENNPARPAPESIVDQTRQALEDFRIPVSPLGKLLPLPFLDQFQQIHDQIFPPDEEEARSRRAVRPTGPVPFWESVRRWNSFILLAILLSIGWILWVWKGGVPSVFFSLFLGYSFVLGISIVVSLIGGILRVRKGMPWSPPPKGTWKDEGKALPGILIGSLVLGGIAWFSLLFVPSAELGRWDVARRRVYTLWPAERTVVDTQGNRYELRSLVKGMGPRLHKFGPDGKLRWVVSLPSLDSNALVLVPKPGGVIAVQSKGTIVRYSPKGVFLSASGLSKSKSGPRNPETAPRQRPEKNSPAPRSNITSRFDAAMNARFAQPVRVHYRIENHDHLWERARKAYNKDGTVPTGWTTSTGQAVYGNDWLYMRDPGGGELLRYTETQLPLDPLKHPDLVTTQTLAVFFDGRESYELTESKTKTGRMQRRLSVAAGNVLNSHFAGSFRYSILSGLVIAQGADQPSVSLSRALHAPGAPAITREADGTVRVEGLPSASGQKIGVAARETPGGFDLLGVQRTFRGTDYRSEIAVREQTHDSRGLSFPKRATFTLGETGKPPARVTTVDVLGVRPLSPGERDAEFVLKVPPGTLPGMDERTGHPMRTVPAIVRLIH